MKSFFKDLIFLFLGVQVTEEESRSTVVWVNTFKSDLRDVVKKGAEVREPYLDEKSVRWSKYDEQMNHIETASGPGLPRLDSTAELIGKLGKK